MGLMGRFGMGRRNKASRRVPVPAPLLLEGLEPRTLLSATLTVSVAPPPTNVAGSARPLLSAQVSNTDPAIASDRADVLSFYAYTGLSFDPGTAVLLGSKTLGRLAPDSSVPVQLTTDSLYGVPAGTYHVAAVVTDPAGNTLAEDDTQAGTMSLTQLPYDLTVSVDKATLPTNVINDKAARGSVTVTLTNTGPNDTPKLPIGVEIVARPQAAGSDTSQDVVISRTVIENVALAQGAAKTVTIPVTFPAGFAPGDYDVIAIGDTGGVLAETNDVNEALANSPASPVAVQAAFTDLAVTTLQFTAPPQPVNGYTSGAGDKFKIPVTFTQNGNVTAPAQHATVVVSAVDIDGNATQVAEFDNVHIGSLSPGETASRNFTVTLPAGLATGSDHFAVQLFSGSNVYDINPVNDTGVTAGFAVLQGTFDVNLTAATSTLLPYLITGTAHRGKVLVTITNSGNLPLPHGQKLALESELTDGSSTFVTGLKKSVSVSNLGPGESRTVAVPVKIVRRNPFSGAYSLNVAATPIQTLIQTDTDNDAIAAQTITFTAARNDLAVSLPSVNGNAQAPLSPLIVGAGQTASVVVRVTNQGTATTGRHQKATLQAVLSTGDGNTADVPLGFLEVSIGRMKPGQTRDFTVPISVNTSAQNRVTTGNYDFYVVLNPNPTLTEATFNNNFAMIAEQRDLAVAIANTTAVTGLLDGESPTGNIDVTLTNAGDAALPDTQTATITAVLRPVGATDSTGDILLGTLANQSVAGLAAGASQSFSLTLDGSGPTLTIGDYNLVVTVTGLPNLVQAAVNNTATSAATYTVTIPTQDVALAIQSVALPSITSGVQTTGSVSVTLTNSGNLPLTAGSTVDLIAVLRPTTSIDNTQDLLLGQLTDQALNNLGVGDTNNFIVSLDTDNAGQNIPASSYNLVVSVFPSDAILADNTANNTATQGPISVLLQLQPS